LDLEVVELMQLWKTEKRDANGLTTVRGLVIPVDWDDRGSITATAIATHFEEEYLIYQNEWGEELLAFLRQKVKVIGFVSEDERGKRIITVKEYELLEE
jgi:hypothetical protein